jgi:ABC-type transport system involved in Fe-S cluster assembly fused permease/ATPase subunit
MILDEATSALDTERLYKCRKYDAEQNVHQLRIAFNYSKADTIIVMRGKKRKITNTGTE